MKIVLLNFGEAFIIDITQVLYFEADDHYTKVFMAEGFKYMVPFGLSRIEETVNEALKRAEEAGTQSAALNYPFGAYMTRIGRRHIVNTSRVFHVNLQKQNVVLSDNKGSLYTLQVSKNVVHQMLDTISNRAK